MTREPGGDDGAEPVGLFIEHEEHEEYEVPRRPYDHLCPRKHVCEVHLQRLLVLASILAASGRRNGAAALS